MRRSLHSQECSDTCDDSVHTHILEEVELWAVRGREGPEQRGQDQEEFHQQEEDMPDQNQLHNSAKWFQIKAI